MRFWSEPESGWSKLLSIVVCERRPETGGPRPPDEVVVAAHPAGRHDHGLGCDLEVDDLDP